MIDGSSDYKTLSFMDAYFVYNKISMDHLDAPMGEVLGLADMEEVISAA